MFSIRCQVDLLQKVNFVTKTLKQTIILFSNNTINFIEIEQTVIAHYRGEVTYFEGHFVAIAGVGTATVEVFKDNQWKIDTIPIVGKNSLGLKQFSVLSGKELIVYGLLISL